jgi:tetratricopeptide (TPR) repeat protein
MTKKTFIPAFLSLVLTGCNSSAPQPVQNSNSAPAPQRTEKMQTAVSHTTENQPPPVSNSSTGAKTKWTQSGNPIDTAKFDKDIDGAQKALKSKPNDEAAKKSLADAYFVRAMALTDARQYPSALGDFRKAVKLDPGNEDAKMWIDQIMTIYDGMNREAPKEGEEPPPLPFKEGGK